MSEQPRDVDHATKEGERTFTEHIEIAASNLVDRTKELIEEGNVRRLIIRNQDDEVLMEVPLTAGVVVGGAITIVAPVLAALGALAALLTHVKIEVVRAREDETDVERRPRVFLTRSRSGVYPLIMSRARRLGRDTIEPAC